MHGAAGIGWARQSAAWLGKARRGCFYGFNNYPIMKRQLIKRTTLPDSQHRDIIIVNVRDTAHSSGMRTERAETRLMRFVGLWIKLLRFAVRNR